MAISPVVGLCRASSKNERKPMRIAFSRFNELATSKAELRERANPKTAMEKIVKAMTNSSRM
jgi:hypothetical protein